jgi:hypothetical protein
MLDPTRSDPPTQHLVALGLGDLAQHAAARISASMSLRISLRAGELTIVHCCTLGDKERRMMLGEPVSEMGRDGTPIRLYTEQLSSVQLRMHCEYGKARIVETKTLASQDQLVQEIVMNLRSVVTTSTRVFTRVSEAALAAQAAAAAAAAALGEAPVQAARKEASAGEGSGGGAGAAAARAASSSAKRAQTI